MKITLQVLEEGFLLTFLTGSSDNGEEAMQLMSSVETSITLAVYEANKNKRASREADHSEVNQDEENDEGEDLVSSSLIKNNPYEYMIKISGDRSEVHAILQNPSIMKKLGPYLGQQTSGFAASHSSAPSLSSGSDPRAYASTLSLSLASSLRTSRSSLPSSSSARMARHVPPVSSRTLGSSSASSLLMPSSSPLPFSSSLPLSSPSPFSSSSSSSRMLLGSPASPPSPMVSTLGRLFLSPMISGSPLYPFSSPTSSHDVFRVPASTPSLSLSPDADEQVDGEPQNVFSFASGSLRSASASLVSHSPVVYADGPDAFSSAPGFPRSVSASSVLSSSPEVDADEEPQLVSSAPALTAPVPARRPKKPTANKVRKNKYADLNNLSLTGYEDNPSPQSSPRLPVSSSLLPMALGSPMSSRISGTPRLAVSSLSLSPEVEAGAGSQLFSFNPVSSAIPVSVQSSMEQKQTKQHTNLAFTGTARNPLKGEVVKSFQVSLSLSKDDARVWSERGMMLKIKLKPKDESQYEFECNFDVIKVSSDTPTVSERFFLSASSLIVCCGYRYNEIAAQSVRLDRKLGDVCHIKVPKRQGHLYVLISESCLKVLAQPGDKSNSPQAFKNRLRKQLVGQLRSYLIEHGFLPGSSVAMSSFSHSASIVDHVHVASGSSSASGLSSASSLPLSSSASSSRLSIAPEWPISSSPLLVNSVLPVSSLQRPMEPGVMTSLSSMSSSPLPIGRGLPLSSPSSTVSLGHRIPVASASSSSLSSDSVLRLWRPVPLRFSMEPLASSSSAATPGPIASVPSALGSSSTSALSALLSSPSSVASLPVAPALSSLLLVTPESPVLSSRLSVTPVLSGLPSQLPVAPASSLQLAITPVSSSRPRMTTSSFFSSSSAPTASLSVPSPLSRKRARPVVAVPAERSSKQEDKKQDGSIPSSKKSKVDGASSSNPRDVKETPEMNESKINKKTAERLCSKLESMVQEYWFVGGPKKDRKPFTFAASLNYSDAKSHALECCDDLPITLESRKLYKRVQTAISKLDKILFWSKLEFLVRKYHTKNGVMVGKQFTFPDLVSYPDDKRKASKCIEDPSSDLESKQIEERIHAAILLLDKEHRIELNWTSKERENKYGATSIPPKSFERQLKDPMPGEEIKEENRMEELIQRDAKSGKLIIDPSLKEKFKDSITFQIIEELHDLYEKGGLRKLEVRGGVLKKNVKTGKMEGGELGKLNQRELRELRALDEEKSSIQRIINAVIVVLLKKASNNQYSITDFKNSKSIERAVQEVIVKIILSRLGKTLHQKKKELIKIGIEGEELNQLIDEVTNDLAQRKERLVKLCMFSRSNSHSANDSASSSLAASNLSLR